MYHLCAGAKLEVEDNQGRQPTHLAAMRDHRDIMEYLYDSGADLESMDDAGKRPVHYAAQYGGETTRTAKQNFLQLGP